jgi:hypothetical protein
MNSRVPKCEPTFAAYQRQLKGFAAYISAMAPCINEHLDAFPMFFESAVVLVVAWNEQFLSSLIGSAVEQREEAVRAFFRSHGTHSDQQQASTCDRMTLAALAKRKINYKNRGKAITRMFDVVFGFSPWPSEMAQNAIVDLVLLRQIFVHHGDRVLEGYGAQISRRDIFIARKYGDLPTIYEVVHSNALPFFKDAIQALGTQYDHVRAELLKREEWTC